MEDADVNESPPSEFVGEEPPQKKSRQSPEAAKPSLVMNLKLKDDQYERVDDANSRPSTALGIMDSANDPASQETPVDSSQANSTNDDGEEEETEQQAALPARDIRASSVAPSTDRRRTRGGRRRARGGHATTLSTRPQRASRTATPDDVFEFRSSPESDEEYEGGSKRRRTAVSEDRSYGDGQDDSKADSEKKRVPPLRITLNLKPTGDDESAPGDSGSSPRSHSSTPKPAQPSPPTTGKRGGRTGRGGGAWGGIRKGDHSEDSTHGQRMTRSKVRQSGAVLDDSIISQRRGKGRRGGLASSASSSSVAAAISTSAGDETVANSPLGDHTLGTPENELVAHLLPSVREPSSELMMREPSLVNVPAPLKLTYENSFEGFRGMRKMIEEKWQSDITKLEVPVPKGFNDYLICTRNYQTEEESSVTNGRSMINAKLMALPADLRRLAEDQDNRRQQLAVEQETERNRLQLFAEKEYLRLLKREASRKPNMSAIRVITESSICNPMYIDDEERLRNPPPTILKSQLMKKYEQMAKEMRCRHLHEAVTLHCAQMRAWESSVKKYIDAQPSPKVTFSFPAENYVHEVEVKMMAFSFD